MQNFNSAELRPVERARAYLLKKMLKKPLREDAGADVLRDSPCTAHVSRKLCIPPAEALQIENEDSHSDEGAETPLCICLNRNAQASGDRWPNGWRYKHPV